MLASFSRLRGSPSPTLAIIQISREGRDFLEESDDFIKWRNGIHRSRSFLRTGIPYSVIRVTVSFFVPFFPSFLFPSFERTTVSPSFEKPAIRENIFLLQRLFDVIFCVKGTDKFDAIFRFSFFRNFFFF